LDAVDAEGIETHARHAKAVRFSGVIALRRAAMELIPDHDGSAKLAARDACWAVNMLFGRRVRYHDLSDIIERVVNAMLEVFDKAWPMGARERAARLNTRREDGHAGVASR
jgi:hypothetical protein